MNSIMFEALKCIFAYYLLIFSLKSSNLFNYHTVHFTYFINLMYIYFTCDIAFNAMCVDF